MYGLLEKSQKSHELPEHFSSRPPEPLSVTEREAGTSLFDVIVLN